MKQIVLVSIAFAVLAGAPAVAAPRHHQQQQQSWTQQQAGSGYYDPTRVRSGDVPFAPF
jgi:hypothetical protein